MTESEIIQIIIGSVEILATLLIAYTVHRQAKTLKKVEIHSRAIEAYNILNRLAISSDENLIAFDSLGRENVNESIEIRRKRWCAFVWLEALQVTFYGFKVKMIDEVYARQALDQQLKIILKDSIVYDSVCERGFHPDFVKYCKEIKKQIDKIDEANPKI